MLRMESIRVWRPRGGRTVLAMKLYRFRWSPFARKVEVLLELAGARFEVVEVPYQNRDELAAVTGGYIYVPVFVDDDGTVVVESRDICAHILRDQAVAARLVPPPWEGPIWAYADFADGPLEDVAFRIASPTVREAWKTPGERALYNLFKERKFGAGCVDAWLRDLDLLVQKAQALLAPTLRTLAARPFLFGDAPTLADAALYGQCKMLEEADPRLLVRVAEPLVPYMRRMEAARATVAVARAPT
jgi:glutathione S-transferase